MSVKHLIDLPLRPAADKKHETDAKLAKAIADASPHVMVVNAVSGGRVILQDLAGNVFDEPYARLGNEVLTSGDLVLVGEIRGWAPDVSPSSMGGTRIVIGRVMTDPAPVNADIVSKMLLSDLDPTGAATNDMVIFGATVWQLKLNQESRNTCGKQDTADTSSTTNSATYVNAMSMTWTLPAGTWTIEADGYADMTRTSGQANLRMSIAGTVDPAPSTVSVSTSTPGQKSTNFILAGVNGATITVILTYKGQSGSGITTTAESPRILLRAIRTA